MELGKYKTRLSLIIISTILLMVVLGFTGALNIMSFQENYSDSLLSSYAVLGRETAGKIEYAIKYGKLLDSFWGMEKLLEEIINISPDIDMAQIMLLNGQVIYDQKGKVNNRYIPLDIIEKINLYDTQDTGSYESMLFDGDYYLFLPIVNRDNQCVGSLNIKFSENVVKSVVYTQMTELVKYLVLLVIAGLLAIIFITMRFSFIEHSGRMLSKKFIIVILILLGFLQIIYGLLNYNVFRKAYLEVAHDNTATISEVIKNNVNSVLEKGVPYTELYNIEDYLKKILAAVPETKNIQIYKDDKGPLYSTGDKVAFQEISTGSEYVHIQKLTTDLQGNAGTLWIEISQEHIASKLRNILLDTATVLIVSFILMVEVTLFVTLLIEKRISNELKKDKIEDWGKKTIPIVRYLAFLVFAAAYMSTTFIPILMNNLYQPLFELPKNVVLGLPISAEMLFGALAAVGAGFCIDKTGNRPILIRGIMLFAAGTLFSAAAWDVLSFIAARSIVGIGFGLVLMSLRTIVVSAPDALLKNQGIAAMNSGAFAGVNCGIVTGGMLADRVGYSRVFFVASILLIISWLAAKAFAENVIPQAAKREFNTTSTTRSFIADKNVLLFFILILIPVSICGMFLNYLFPIYADSMGASSSSIGRAFLINGLLIIYLGPILSRYSEKYFGAKKSLVTASLIMGCSLLIFAGVGTLAAAYITVMLLGLADSFGVAAQSNYFLSLGAVSCLGEGRAVAYFSIIGKLGQMLGPIILGAAAVLGITRGTGVIGGIAVISVSFFALSNKGFPIMKKLTR